MVFRFIVFLSPSYETPIADAFINFKGRISHDALIESFNRNFQIQLKVFFVFFHPPPPPPPPPPIEIENYMNCPTMASYRSVIQIRAGLFQAVL